MRNLKRLIALVAVLAMTVSTVAFASNYSDVTEDSAYYTAVETLSKLGVVTGYEDGTYKPEESVTRAEMAALIARIQGYEETAKANANTKFTDVPFENWASGYVAQASNQGIVNGYGDGTFGPDDSVLYEQAVKMIMCTLGYEPYAAKNGGYPTGYLAAAKKYNVTNNVSNAVTGTEANRGTIAQLLANAIDTALMEQYSWSNDGSVDYIIYDGSDSVGGVLKTLMSENLNVVKLKGLVMSNTVTSLDGSKTIDLNKTPEVTVAITDNYGTTDDEFKNIADNAYVQKTFEVAESDIEDFVGQAVILYATKNANDKYEVISVATDAARNASISFTLDQYSTFDGTYIQYYKNDTDKNATKVKVQTTGIVDGNNASLKAPVYIVYNGTGMTGAVADYFGTSSNDNKVVVPDSTYGGKVTLLDTDSISGYDVIFIEEAATAVVDSTASKRISLKDGITLPDGGKLASKITVDEDDATKVVNITKDGEAIAYTDLKEWDVLSIVKDKSTDVINIEVITNAVTGSVSATYSSTTSYAGTGIKIDGVKYDIAENNYEADNLSVGDAGIFYIDKYGKVAAFDQDASATGVAGNYAFVLATGTEQGTLGDDILKIQMLTANGVETFEAASKVTFYDGSAANIDFGTTKKATIDTTTCYTDGATAAAPSMNAAIAGTVVKYTTNSSSKIASITTANYNTDKFTLNANNKTTAYNYDADTAKVGSSYIDDNALVFLVDVKDSGVGYDTDNCEMGSLSDLTDEVSYKYMAYADNKAEDNNIIVLFDANTSAASVDGIGIVKEVAKSTNDNSEDIYSLTILLGGEEVTADTIAITDNNVEDNINEGDIVKVKFNGAGVMKSVKTYYAATADIRDGAEVVGSTDHSYPSRLVAPGAKEAIVAGYPTAYKKSGRVVTIAGTDYKLNEATNVYTIDTSLKNDKIYVGDASDFSWDDSLRTDKYYITYNNVSTYKTIVDADKFADYLIIRKYDDKVVDVIVVKGMEYTYGAAYTD